MRIAQFKTSPTDSSVWISTESGGEACVLYSGWVRISEYIDAEFPPLPANVVVEGQLKQLDVLEQELRSKFQEKLNQLANERAKLLSLTHEKQS